MRERGFLLGLGGTYGNVLRFQPPLVIEPADLQMAVAALAECLTRPSSCLQVGFPHFVLGS